MRTINRKKVALISAACFGVTWTVYCVSSADMDQVSIRDFKTGVAVICFASMAVYFMVFYAFSTIARAFLRARPVENFKDWIYSDEPLVPERPAAPPPIDLTDGWAGFWRSLRRGE
jgi:hypothetical protein